MFHFRRGNTFYLTSGDLEGSPEVRGLQYCIFRLLVPLSSIIIIYMFVKMSVILWSMFLVPYFVVLLWCFLSYSCNSGPIYQINCAFYDRSMKLSVVFLYTMKFVFRRGCTSELTSGIGQRPNPSAMKPPSAMKKIQRGVNAHVIPLFWLIGVWGIHFWYCFEHFGLSWLWKSWSFCYSKDHGHILAIVVGKNWCTCLNQLFWHVQFISDIALATKDHLVLAI